MPNRSARARRFFISSSSAVAGSPTLEVAFTAVEGVWEVALVVVGAGSFLDAGLADVYSIGTWFSLTRIKRRTTQRTVFDGFEGGSAAAFVVASVPADQSKLKTT